MDAQHGPPGAGEVSRRRPELPRFRVPLNPVLPLATALACLYLMLNLSVATWLRFLVWLVVGLAVYFGYGRRNTKLRDDRDT
ncbi:amino acid permease C-terminal domain-containing protein [Actinocatenispora comari]|uniref:amino acid permease C-terminal domain-containing protein n=1 Tax=Actinocatenispora comari TaxID=2807577 RepID=UPI001A913248|nr:amino acid permease C-terminal domain-containing protein [Actinocatenispora comari]